MKYTPTNLVNVFYKPEQIKIPVGRLALKARQIFFEYDPEFIQTEIQLSPFKLPLKPGVFTSPDRLFDGLFGLFNDSLPDGWGRLLLDRALLKHQINAASLSPLDRLCFVGSQGMGALIYEPEAENAPLLSKHSLEEIAAHIAEFQEDQADDTVETLLKLGGSSAGARPKVLMKQKGECWLVKFPSSTDPKDIGGIEYAYNLMAQNAGLDTPEIKLFPSSTNAGFFGSRCFDRTQNSRIHMHSVSGLLHADHRIPNLDYRMIMKAGLNLTHNVIECEKIYRQCVFNVLSHNRDDHAKNFSFLMDSKGVWHVSPAYDLTFSSGPSGEHCTTVMGEGKNPGLTHLLELAKVSNIKKTKALQIIEEVKSVTSQWKRYARQSGVNAKSIAFIDKALQTSCV